MVKSRTNKKKSFARSDMRIAQLKRLETKLAKKKAELLEIKALHRKIAREFIDLWIETRRLKRKR